MQCEIVEVASVEDSTGYPCSVPKLERSSAKSQFRCLRGCVCFCASMKCEERREETDLLRRLP